MNHFVAFSPIFCLFVVIYIKIVAGLLFLSALFGLLLAEIEDSNCSLVQPNSVNVTLREDYAFSTSFETECTSTS